MLLERLRCIEDFRLSRARSLSPGAARTVDILAAMMARAARESGLCSVYAPGIDWPAAEGDGPEAGQRQLLSPSTIQMVVSGGATPAVTMPRPPRAIASAVEKITVLD